MKMSSLGIMSHNNPGLCPVKVQNSGLCIQTGAWNHFSSLSLSTTKIVPHYQMLAINPTFCFPFYALPRGPKDGSDCTNFWTVESLTSLSAVSFPCTPASTETQYSSTVSRGEVNQRLLALSYHDIMLHKIVILMDDILLLENSFEIFLNKWCSNRIPRGAWIFVCCECRVLSGRGLCDELITRPEES